MKIVFFIPSLIGGAERVACTISKILVAAGHKVTCCLIGQQNQLTSFLPAEAEVRWHQREKFNDGLLGIMRETINEVRPDYVFGTETAVNWRLVVAVLTSRHKPQIILRNEVGLFARSFSQKLRYAVTYPFAKTIITQTDEMRDECIKVLHLSKKKVLAIPNPIDRSFVEEKLKEGNPYPAEGKGNPTYVTVGRYYFTKGYDMLIKAFRIVKATQPEAKLYIVGRIDETDHYHEVMTLIEQYGLSDSIVLTGFQANPYVYMQHADCFVLSSRREGLPNVMLEAMYCGTPVAAFKCIPVIERIVEEGSTGFLAEKEDVEGLAQAMLCAPKLGRIVSSYMGNTDEMFVKLFE